MVGRLLARKLRRDLRRNAGSLVAIAVVVASGTSTFVGMQAMGRALDEAQQAYYRDARFPDLFVQVHRAPDALLTELAALPGVARLQARASGEVVVRVPGLREPATARLVGVAAPGPASLNLVILRAGRLPAANELDAVTISEGFASANRLIVGDSLGAVIGDRWRTLRIVGIGISPEFVYELRPGDVLPDSRRYGVLWASEETAERAFGLVGAWNDAAVTLAPGASERAVIASLDAVLARSGTFGAYGRDLHASHRFLSEEIRQNKTFATVLPVIFLAVAAFLVNLVLGRVVARQRDQIGTLKAFGLPSAFLVRHYLSFAMVPVLAGGAIGIALGTALAQYLAALYQDFFRFPSLTTPFYLDIAAVTLVIAGIAAAVGALGALRRVLSLPPAEAMRPEPPAAYASGIAERILGRRGSPVVRMITRALTHRPWRTALGGLGIGLGSAVVIVGTFGFDAVERMREVLFVRGQRADVSVSFTEPRTRAAAVALLEMPGVRRVELGSEMAVRAVRGARSYRTAIVAVDEHNELRRVVSLTGREARIAPFGVSLSRSLAIRLMADRGDSIRLEFLDGRNRVAQARVAAVVDDLSGSVVYVARDELPRLAGLGESVSSADLTVDADAIDALYARLLITPGIRGVLARDALEAAFDATIRRNFVVVLVTLVTLAGALSAGTIYNAGRVTLSERARDLASLRVLGFTRGEAARILFGELAALAVVGIPVGIGIGVFFAWATVASFGSSELFRMPLVIGPRTITAGIAIPIAAALLSLWPLRYRLDRLNLIESLKTRE